MTGESRGIEKLLASQDRAGPGLGGLTIDSARGATRMKELGLNDLDAYASLRQSEAELQALIEEVVVSGELVLPRRATVPMVAGVRPRAVAVDNPARPPLRVLSLACAAGEEPYSIAMTLLEWASGSPVQDRRR